MKENAEREQNAVPLRWELVVYPLPFGLALVLRILRLGVFTAWDELAWTFRAGRFWQALSQRSFDPSTMSDPHGTVALWFTSLGFALRRLLEGPGTAPAWHELAGLAAFDPLNLAQLRLVASFWPTAALAVAAANAAVTIILAILVARLWGARAGLLASLLLAATPFYLALSRVLGPDALTAGLTVGALLALLWALRNPRRWVPFILSGALGGLALLNQSLVAILVPYSLLLLAVAHLAQRRPPLLWLRNSALWAGALLAACLLVYPGTWSTPLTAIRVLLTHLGNAVPLPGPPPSLPADLVAVGLRMTPLSLAGVALALLRLPMDRDRHRLPALALLAFAALFWRLAPGVGWQSGWQGLTVVVTLDVAAAVGLDGVVAMVLRLAPSRRERLALGLNLALSALLIAAIGWQAKEVISYQPYYPAYRNPWLVARAATETEAGWGEGMDQVASYLNAQPGAARLQAATLDVPALAPFFVGETVPLTTDTLQTADYVVVYNRSWLRAEPLLAPLLQATPQQIVRLHGREYARIYANQAHRPIVELLTEQAHPDDIVILDAPSPFAHDYDGPAPYQDLRVESPAQVAAALNGLASGRWRLWHVAFEGADPQHVVRSLLESQAMLLERREVPGAIVSTYLLPLQIHFSPLEPDQEVELEFPAGLTLERAGLASAQVQYRQKIALVLRWRARSKPDANVAISLRLVDEQEQRWAQQDSWIVDANGRSTAAWSGGEAVQTVHTLVVPPGLPPGVHRLRIVLYMADSLKPLVALDPAVAAGDGQVDLLPLEVLPAQMPPTVEELGLERPLQAALADGVEVLACELGSQTLRPGQGLSLTVWWRTTRPVTTTYQAHLMLVDANGDLRGDGVVELAGAGHPTTAWIQGEVIAGRYRLGVSPDAVPGEAIVGVELLAPQGPAGTPVRLGAVQVATAEHIFQPPPIQRPRQETLGQMVRLLGYDLEPLNLKPGQALHLTLYWQDLAPMQTSYTVFTHLLDPDGRMWGGHDSIPVRGTRPTSAWVLHEVLTDPHEINVPPDARPGHYSLEVGLYDASTGARLPAFDSAGARLAQDRILLGTVVIE